MQFQSNQLLWFLFASISGLHRTHRLRSQGKNYTKRSSKACVQSHAVCAGETLQFVSECSRTTQKSRTDKESQRSDQGGGRRLAKCELN